eukprot:917772-Rhodomonas_salina.1
MGRFQIKGFCRTSVCGIQMVPRASLCSRICAHTHQPTCQVLCLTPAAASNHVIDGVVRHIRSHQITSDQRKKERGRDTDPRAKVTNAHRHILTSFAPHRASPAASHSQEPIPATCRLPSQTDRTRRSRRM